MMRNAKVSGERCGVSVVESLISLSAYDLPGLVVHMQTLVGSLRDDVGALVACYITVQQPFDC